MAEERPDYQQENLLLTARCLALFSGVCLVGAVLAYATGDEVYARGGSFRSHMDAVWVLSVLALASFTAVPLVTGEMRARRWKPSPMRSHHD
jgi:hypothetical protein